MQHATCPECGTQVGGSNHATRDRRATSFLYDAQVQLPQGFDNRNLNLAAL